MQRRVGLGVFLLQVVGAALAAEPAETSRYSVGVAAVDVTPEYPVRLNGFGFRRTEHEGVTQRIWTKALAIDAGDERPVVVITLDNLGVRLALVDEVAGRLATKAGLERDRVVLTFTHTHTAPKVNGACETIMDWPVPAEHQRHIERYTADLTDAIEKAALAALADRQPARLEWAMGGVGFAKNRRPQGGPVDHALPMLVVRSAEDDRIRAIYATYACHCVTLSHNQVSGDWAGYAQAAIERDHPGAVAMVSIGCGSDANPSSGVTGDNIAVAAEQGAEIAREVGRLLQGPRTPIIGAINTSFATIDLPLNKLPAREELEALAAQQDPPGANARYQLDHLARGESLQTAIVYPIQTISFGDALAMIFLAGEVCADYSLRLKQEFDAARVWPHGYSNDFGCYIPSERLLAEGGYGGGAEIVYFALPATLAPGLEARIIAEVHRQVPRQFRRSDAADTIAALLEGLAVGTPAEYERIPDIWRAAIDAGKRNQASELRRLIELSVPGMSESATHWQVVVIGGGVINGLSIEGMWPRQRITELLQTNATLQRRWDRFVALSAEMADDESVRAGTRYDALRILGIATFDEHGAQLARYLTDANSELQMGAVSGLSDIDDERAAGAILEAFPSYTESNRKLAIDALLRTPERRARLQAALDEDRISRDLLTPEQAAQLSK